MSFSALQRAEIAEISVVTVPPAASPEVSVLFNEPKLLKSGRATTRQSPSANVSVLFNEPKLLKSTTRAVCQAGNSRFSALQRAEIAEMLDRAI